MSGQNLNVSAKSLWKKIEKQGFKFYCVGCNRERRQTHPARIGSPKFFGQILITTAFFTTLAYPWLHWKGFFAFVIPVGLVMEGLFRMKMRAALVCPDCGFDPILYIVNRDQAVRQVEETWRKKFAETGNVYPESKKRRAKKEETLTSP